MATYSFKSSGKTQEQKDLEDTSQAPTPTPFGIKTPLQLGSSDGLLIMNYSLEEQFADNLRNLLQTNWGERLGLYQYGANLKPLTTEFVSQENFDNRAIDRIKSTVGTWMPFVELEEFTSTVDRIGNKDVGIINVNVTYRIPALSTDKKAVQIVLYVI